MNEKREQDLEHPKWPHLDNLDRVPELLKTTGKAVVTEKVHGFNARFGRTSDGAFWTGGRNNVAYSAADAEALSAAIIDKQAVMQGFTAWAIEQEVLVAPGTTYFGEWAGKGVQKGIDYGEKQFYLFGMSIDENGFRALVETMFAAQALGCMHVPVIWEGPMEELTMEMLTKWRTKSSALAPADLAEGIVITANPMLQDEYGHTVIGKYKSPEFAERQSERKRDKAPVDLTNVQAFVDEFATDMRLTHVLDDLRDADMDGLDRRNMGDMLRAFYNDVTREGKVEYDALSENDQKMVGRVLNKSVKVLIDARLVDSINEAMTDPTPPM